MSKKIELFIKTILVVSFFVPLIVFPSSYIFPFIVPKIVFFRSLVLIMLGAYIILLFSNWQKYRLKLSAINIGVLVFLLSFLISTIVGVDAYKSFWDCHERMLGLFTIFHYIIYYFIITSVISKWEDWKWIFRIFLGAGFLVMFVGLLQKANPEFLLNKGNARVSATLGNAIYFSGYGLFLFLLGLFLAVKEKYKKENFWFWFSAIASLFGFLGIFWGGTRGALLGLLVALFILLVLYIFSLQDEKHKKYKYILISAIFLGIIVLGLSYNFRKTDFIKSIPAYGRLLNTDVSQNNTRVMAWSIAIDAWKEKPIFGWGPNNYYYAFNKYYKPEFLRQGWGETWFDNAHSVIMNTIAVQGLFGILSYLAIYVLVVLAIYRAYKSKKIDSHTAFFGVAIILSHLVAVATVFDNPTSYLYFFVFLAFINSSSTADFTEEKNKFSKDLNIPLSVFVSLFVLLFIYSTNINPARANKATLDSIRAIYNGSNAVQVYNEAIKIPSPHIDDIRNDFGKIAAENLPKYIEAKRMTEANAMFDLAMAEFKKNLFLHPNDIRVKIAIADLAQLGASFKKDPDLLILAEKLIDEALEFSPKRQQLLFSGAILKMYLAKNVEAEKLLKQAVDLDPKVAESWGRLASFYSQIGARESAEEILAKAESEYGFKFQIDKNGVIKQLVK